jgi:HK97 family phage portal protein
MGYWRNLWGSVVGKSAGTTAANPAQWFVDWIRGDEDTVSGVSVTPEAAMRLAAVWACVRVRSEDIGKLPLLMYRRNPDGSKQRVDDHPLASVMQYQANDYQTAFEFRQLMQAWIDTRGNAYAFKELDDRGRVMALWPVNPQWVTILRWPAGQNAWEIFYLIHVPGPNGFTVTVPQEAILHVRGMTLDGFRGLSPISYHRETIGLGIAAQRYGSAFFGNGAQPEGAIKVPTTLSPEAARQLRASWEATHKGSGNSRKLAILDGGMEWQATAITNEDAQYISTRQMQNTQIYSLFRVPAHKVGDLSKATFSNIEQQALEYVSDCLMSEMVRWEQAIRRDLLLDQEKKRYFFEFNADSLLRGDLLSRSQAYASARQWGWLSVNDIRDRENMNRVQDGDIYLQPMNMQDAGAPPPEPAPAPALAPPEEAPAPAKPKPKRNGKDLHP